MDLMPNCSLEEMKNPYVLLERWSMNDINCYLMRPVTEQNNQSTEDINDSNFQESVEHVNSHDNKNFVINFTSNGCTEEKKNPYVLLERWSMDDIKY